MKESFEFIRKLNQQAIAERGNRDISLTALSGTEELFFREPSLARIMAMSELLNWSPTELSDHLMDCMLADAHNGFLASYDNPDDRARDDELLKSRVRHWREILNNNNSRQL
ncbi:hypothetical protein [Pseudoteredinibacter isoporae]|uniref:hypothetical protein n=1 Tax=Pseudoteredinibacter isoporae TaxID=570281 RepID=UPI003106A3FD